MGTITELAHDGRWKIIQVEDAGAGSGRCCEVCSRPIRYIYTVKNLTTGHTQETGSTCGPTLVKVSWSEAHQKEILAAYEKRLGRTLTPEEIESEKAAHSKAEWKTMAKAYVQEQAEKSKQDLPKLLARYVSLNPGHMFPKSLLEQLQRKGSLSVKQLECATEILSGADWEKMEKEFAVRYAPPAKTQEVGGTLTKLLALPNLNTKDRELLASFQAQFKQRGTLSPKQTYVVEKIAKFFLKAG